MDLRGPGWHFDNIIHFCVFLCLTVLIYLYV